MNKETSSLVFNSLPPASENNVFAHRIVCVRINYGNNVVNGKGTKLLSRNPFRSVNVIALTKDFFQKNVISDDADFLGQRFRIANEFVVGAKGEVVDKDEFHDLNKSDE